jgi:hypothetical protein
MTEKGKKKNEMRELVDNKVNIRIIIASLWVVQFLIWTFGDMVALLQQLHDPASNYLMAFVAAPLALIQGFMIIFTLCGPVKIIRIANFVVVPIFLLFNIGFLFESVYGWEFVLGAGYVITNIMIIVKTWKWPRFHIGGN